MKYLLHTAFILVTYAVSTPCIAQKQAKLKPQQVYLSDSLVITRLSENSFEHTTFLQTNDFGNVPCNGLVVKNGSEAIIFDTPTTNETAIALIHWVKETLKCTIVAIIPTHFHNDCLAGLSTFHENNIPSYANFKTIELARTSGYPVPIHSFTDSLVLKVGAEKVMVTFFGEGHTKDNVVGYFPSENILFGGCLIKEVKAGKGFLGDANVPAWSGTVEKIKAAYPHVKIIVPGHGQFGNKKLLDYTIRLFRQ